MVRIEPGNFLMLKRPQMDPTETDYKDGRWMDRVQWQMMLIL
jgi:hypothetical protein